MKIKDRHKISVAFDIIGEIERKYEVDLVSLPDGAKLWNLIRILLYFYLQKEKSRKLSDKFKKNYNFRLKISTIKEGLTPLKIPSKEIRICGFSNTGSRKYRDGKFYDIYLDTLDDLMGNDFVVFEWPSEQGHRQNYGGMIYSKNYVPLHLPFTTKTFWDIILYKFFNKTSYKIQNLSILDEIIDYFANSVNLEKEMVNKYINESIAIFWYMKGFFKKLLSSISPKLVLIVCGYGRINMAIVQACRELNIPSVELQHGLITENHPGYVKTMKSDNRDCVPEYLLTYGDFFADIVRRGNLFEKEKVVSVGFPYLEEVKKSKPVIDEKLKEFISSFARNILITSQWTVAEEIKKFTIDLSKELIKNRLNVGIIFKPHQHDWREYTNIENHGNIFLASKYDDIYEILKVVDIHSTVYSTSGIEALAFGKPNIFVDTGKTNVTDIIDIIDDKTSFVANSPVKFIEKLNFILQSYERISTETMKISEKFFKPNAKKNIEKFFDSMGAI